MEIRDQTSIPHYGLANNGGSSSQSSKPLHCNPDLSVQIAHLESEIGKSSGIKKLFHDLGLSSKGYELKKLQRELQANEPKSERGLALQKLQSSFRARFSSILKKIHNSSSRIDSLRAKNLEISKRPVEDKPQGKIAMSEEQFADKGKDVHGGRVWLTKKTTTSAGEVKTTPSQWYKKDNGVFEILHAPIYSLLVPGSPEGALVNVKINDRDYQEYASKQIEGAKQPTARDLKSGKMQGLAKCAVAVALFGYKDIRPGNALLDKHNRMVMLDYEMHTPGATTKKDVQSLLQSPLGKAKSFFNSSESPTSDLVAKYENSTHFKAEMSRAMIHFLAFPSEMLTTVIDKRIEASPVFDRWSGKEITDELAESISILKAQLLSNTSEGASWREEIMKGLEGDLDALAKDLVNDMADSRIMRELQYDDVVQQVKNNLEKLRNDFR